MKAKIQTNRQTNKEPNKQTKKRNKQKKKAKSGFELYRIRLHELRENCTNIAEIAGWNPVQIQISFQASIISQLFKLRTYLRSSSLVEGHFRVAVNLILMLPTHENIEQDNNNKCMGERG